MYVMSLNAASKEKPVQNFLTSLIEAYPDASMRDIAVLFTDVVGSTAFYRQVRATVERERIVTREGFAQAWVWRDMACGTGACEGCLTPTRHGPRRACTDGPFFDLLDLTFN